MSDSNLGRIEEKLDNLLELMTGIRVDQATSRRDIDLLFDEVKGLHRREMELTKDMSHSIEGNLDKIRETQRDVDRLGEKVRDNSKMTGNISRVVWLVVAAIVTFAAKLIYEGIGS